MKKQEINKFNQNNRELETDFLGNGEVMLGYFRKNPAEISKYMDFIKKQPERDQEDIYFIFEGNKKYMPHADIDNDKEMLSWVNAIRAQKFNKLGTFNKNCNITIAEGKEGNEPDIKWYYCREESKERKIYDEIVDLKEKMKYVDALDCLSAAQMIEYFTNKPWEITQYKNLIGEQSDINQKKIFAIIGTNAENIQAIEEVISLPMSDGLSQSTVIGESEGSDF